MKTSAIFFKYGLIICALTIISCDKQEAEMNSPQEAVLEEGFMSSTNNFDSEIDESQEPLTPLLHRSYDASLSEEEATAKFQKEFSKIQKEMGQTNKRTKAVFYTIRTLTGTSAHAATDGRVGARVYFSTNEISFSRYHTLNHRGDDREKGQWDIYGFTVYVEPSTTEWVELKRALLELKGTDGWYVRTFLVDIKRSQQHISYNRLIGGSTISAVPKTWLDSNYDNFWDVYSTGTIGKGRLEYKYPYFH